MLAARLLSLYRLYKRDARPGALVTRRFIARAGALRAAEVSVCLDIGAGIAPRRPELSQHFAVQHYFAVDFVVSDAVNLIADARCLPVRDQSVDLVVCLEVLQHIPEVSSALDEIRRVLRPGGNVLVSFPFMLGECDVADFHRWTVAGMSHEFEKRGFTVISMARRGGLFYVMTNSLISAVNKAVLGDRKTWRASRTLATYAREGILVVLTFPFLALGWLAFAVDHLLPQSVCYTGALIFASREGSGERTAAAVATLAAA